MEPTQPTPTNPILPGGSVDPNQSSGGIEFPSIAAPNSPQPDPAPSPSLAANQPAANPFNETTSITSSPLNTTSPMSNNPTTMLESSPLDPIAVDPIPPSNGMSKFKIPFPAIIIGLIVLVILIVILSLTVTNSVKPTTQTVNNGTTTQTPQ